MIVFLFYCSKPTVSHFFLCLLIRAVRNVKSSAVCTNLDDRNHGCSQFQVVLFNSRINHHQNHFHVSRISPRVPNSPRLSASKLALTVSEGLPDQAAFVTVWGKNGGKFDSHIHDNISTPFTNYSHTHWLHYQSHKYNICL